MVQRRPLVIISGAKQELPVGDTLPVTKADVGLGSVDNTSDLNKPISTATQTALNAKQSTSEKGAANGYASLDSAGKVPAVQLPSYVDDVQEYANLAAFPATGVAGIIYVTADTNKTYRWTGTGYAEISASPGSTDGVAEGATNLYFTYQRVRDTVLTGLSLATSAAISAADTVLSALGKLQAQITAHIGSGGGAHAAATGAAAGFLSADDQTIGGTKTFNIGPIAPNYRDGVGPNNVNLGSGGSEGRGLVAGYSGGAYGGIGYNIRHTEVGGQYVAPSPDTVSYLLFSAGGFIFLSAPIGGAGRSPVLATLAQLTAAGAFSATSFAGAGTGLTGTAAGLSIGGNAATANALTTPRTINGVNFNGSANIETSEWIHSLRDFTLGTVITTAIDYSGTYGEPWILELKGNSYGSLAPFDIQVQGYIYSGTIINFGGVSNGTLPPGIVALNVGGLLTFWFPPSGYWQGFNARAYVAQPGRAYNRITSITNGAKPAGTKEVSLSPNIVQSLHSGNYSSYAQPLLGYTPENVANKGAANGYASLDSAGKVPAAQLPSYVDDVLEYANLAGFPGTGTAGVIYIALDTNKTYRWGGSAYTEISASPGSTDSVVEGAANLYFTYQRVRDTVLTGLSTATNAVITAADTVLSALGKLQKQITDHVGFGGTAHPAATTSVAGFMSAADKAKLDGALVAGLPRGYIDGLTFPPNSNGFTITVQPGAATDSSNTASIVVATAITKSVAAAWAAGSGVNVGGVDTGATYTASAMGGWCSLAGTVMTCNTAPTQGIFRVGQELRGEDIPAGIRITSLGTGTGGVGTYNLSSSITRVNRHMHGIMDFSVFVIKNPTSGAVDVITSRSATPTLPTGFTLYRYIGCLYMTHDGYVAKATQIGDDFFLYTPYLDFYTGGADTSQSVAVGMLVPTNRMLVLTLNAMAQGGSYLMQYASAAGPASSNGAPLYNVGGQATQLQVMSSLSASIIYRTGAPGWIYASTLGWRDNRGKDS